MIPRTYPSQISAITGHREMIVSNLSSVSGLAAWTDYIPVRYVESYDTQEGSYGDVYDGFISVTEIDSTGLTPFKDYVPVYYDPSATDAWIVDATGYIPVEHSGFSSVRDIATLSGTQYGTLDTVIVANAGDTLEIKFATTNAGAIHFLVDGDVTGATRGKLYFDAADAFQFDASATTSVTLDGASVTTGVTAAPNDGKEHTIILTYAAGIKLGVIGAAWDTTLPFSGQIFSVKYTDKSGASDVVTNIVFDSGSDLYQLARGTALGGDEVTNGVFDADTDWTLGAGWVISGGVATHAAGTGSRIYQNTLSLTADSSVLMAVTVSGMTAGTLDMQIGTDGAGASYDTFKQISSNGTYLVIGVPDAGDNAVGFYGSTTFDGSIDNVSVKQLPDSAVILNNFALSDWSRYTLQRNIVHDAGTVALGWVIENLLLSPNDFSNVAWVKSATATVTGTNVLNFPAVADAIEQTVSINIAGLTVNNGIYLSGTGTTHVQLTNLIDFAVTLPITLTASPTLYRFDDIFNSTTTSTVKFRIYRDTGDTATAVTASNALTQYIIEVV